MLDTTHPYRLLNVGTDKYLSINPNDPDHTSLESDNPADKKQKWNFVAVNGGFRIYTVKNDLYLDYQFYSNPTIYIPVALLPTARISVPTSGVVSLVDGADDVFKLKWKTVWLESSGNSVTLRTPSTGTNVGRWKFVSTSTHQDQAVLISKDPLPVPETYRIRSYNSKYLLTISDDGRVYITLQMQGAENLRRQTWSVNRDATGLYTIQNQLTVNNRMHFLAAGTEAAVFTSESSYTWTLQSFSQGLQFLIGLRRGGQSLSIGFSDYEAEEFDEVALVESDGIPSQLWFFEKAKAPGKDQIHAKRLLLEGTYRILSSHSNKYMVRKHDNSGKLTGSKTIDDLDAGLFTLKYTNSAPSPFFTLQNKKRREYIVGGNGLAELNSVVEPSDSLAHWIVLPHKTAGSATLYYICCPAREHPVKTISCSQVGAHEEFVLEDMVKGHTMHQWQLIEERGN